MIKKNENSKGNFQKIRHCSVIPMAVPKGVHVSPEQFYGTRSKLFMHKFKKRDQAVCLE